MGVCKEGKIMDINKLNESCSGLTGHPLSTIFGFILLIGYSLLKWKIPELANIIGSLATGTIGIQLLGYKGGNQGK